MIVLKKVQNYVPPAIVPITVIHHKTLHNKSLFLSAQHLIYHLSSDSNVKLIF